MTVTAAGYAASRQILFDGNAKPVIGGFLYVNAAGSTSLVTSYADAQLQTANPNPLRTDAFGRISPIYFGAGTFKVVAQDASGAQLWVDDNLPSGVDYDAKAAAAAAQAGAALSGATTGDVKFKHGSGIDAGWVRCNGQTIGNGGSQGIERANDDTKALFVYLWNNDAALAVSGNRGVTATADFNAAKTITLPDYRGRVLAGCDGMGAASLAGVLTGASTASPNTVGTKFGIDAVTLSADQLPNITPQITIANGGGHTHPSLRLGDSGAHTHALHEDAHSHTTSLNTLNTAYATPNSGGTSALSYNAPPNVQTTSAVKTNITLDPVGNHNHDVFFDASDGAHQHTATSSSFGLGNPHINDQPTILGYFHIKL